MISCALKQTLLMNGAASNFKTGFSATENALNAMPNG
jgi:hypothetical protein